MAKCLVKIQTRRGLRLQMVNHCSSDVFVRLLRHGSKITARNAGRCPALGCHAETGEGCALPASCWSRAAGQEAKGSLVSEVCDKDGPERGRETK